MEYEEKTRLSEVVYKPTVLSKGEEESGQTQLLRAEEENVEGSSGSFLYVSAFAVNLIIFAAGSSFSWTSPVIPKLTGDDNPLPSPVTANEESWIAGLLCLGAALGPIFAGRTADKLGRKPTLQLLALPMLLSYITLALSHYIYLFYLARFCLGLGVGGSFAIVPMYLGEISEDHNRGLIGCLVGVFVSVGLLFSFGVGPFMSIKMFSLACAVPLVVFLLVFTLFIPESPQFLASIGRENEAEDSLRKLRGKSKAGVQKELKLLLQNSNNEKENHGGLRELFGSPGLRRGITISSGLVMLQQLAGINAVLAYMQSIFDASGSGLSSSFSTIIIGSVQVVATVFTSLIVEKLGRKSLLLISTTGACISIITLGAFFFLKNKQVNLDSFGWLPVLSLIVYIATFNFGLGPLPWAILGELFPSNVKSAASTLTTFVCFFVSFLITLVFPFLAKFLGMAQTFWFFGGFCALGVGFIFVLVPETKGKSLAEIQMLLSGVKS